MRLIVLMGEGKVGKTNALKLLKKVNDGTIEYFQDDVRVSDITELTIRDEKLGVVTTNDYRIKNKIDIESLFMISRSSELPSKFIISNKSKELNWTEALNWSKSNENKGQRPDIIDEFFNFICK